MDTAKLPEIPNHEVIRKIGEGGMASVYLARHIRLNRQVAVKVLSASLHADDQFSSRFEREAQTVARLSHPNIVPVFDFGESSQGELYISMAYVPGGSLADRLRRDGPLPAEDAFRIARHITQALAHAHGAGVIHRDIKPDNILLADSGTPMLADFGIAKLNDAQAALTATQTTIGTFSYMAPEQINGAVDERADLYSVGVTLFECLTGETPLHADSIPGMIHSILEEKPSRLPPGLIEHQPLLDRMLAKSPDDRFASARELLAVLQSETPGTSVAYQPEQKTYVHPVHQPNRSVSRFLVPVLCITAVLAVGGYWYLLDDAGERGAEPNESAVVFDRSIAIMPFSVLDDARNATFGATFREELRVAIAGYPELQEIAPHVSGDTIEVERASYALHGSLESTGGNVRLRAQLVRTSDSHTVWAQSFEQPAIEGSHGPAELATIVSRFVRLQLVQDHQCELVKRSTKKKAAAEAYCVALAENHRLNQIGEYDAKILLANAQRALDLDPNLPEAYALIAAAYFFVPFDSWEERNGAIRNVLERGLSLNPNHPELLTYRGMARMQFDLDYSAARSDFEQSLSLDPQHPYARWNHAGLGMVALSLGRLNQALDHYRRATRIYDADGRVRFEYTAALVCARQYERAIEEADQALTLVSHGFYRSATIAYKAFSLLALGRTKEANTLLDETLASVQPEQSVRFIDMLALAGREDQARQMLSPLAEAIAAPPFILAYSYVALRNYDEGFKWLYEAVDQRAGITPYLRTHPIFEEARRDPRWKELILHLETQETRAGVSGAFKSQ